MSKKKTKNNKSKAKSKNRMKKSYESNGAAAPTIEVWKRVETDVDVSVENGWLRVDIGAGQYIRIQLPGDKGSKGSKGSKGGKGGNKNEGPVVFEDFHMETEFPIEERKIQREQGGQLLPWENAYPGATNVVSSSSVSGGVWRQGTPASPGPGHYIRRVNLMPGMAPQNVWQPGQPV